MDARLPVELLSLVWEHMDAREQIRFIDSSNYAAKAVAVFPRSRHAPRHTVEYKDVHRLKSEQAKAKLLCGLWAVRYFRSASDRAKRVLEDLCASSVEIEEEEYEEPCYDSDTDSDEWADLQAGCPQTAVRVRLADTCFVSRKLFQHVTHLTITPLLTPNTYTKTVMPTLTSLRELRVDGIRDFECRPQPLLRAYYYRQASHNVTAWFPNAPRLRTLWVEAQCWDDALFRYRDRYPELNSVTLLDFDSNIPHRDTIWVGDDYDDREPIGVLKGDIFKGVEAVSLVSPDLTFCASGLRSAHCVQLECDRIYWMETITPLPQIAIKADETFAGSDDEPGSMKGGEIITDDTSDTLGYCGKLAFFARYIGPQTLVSLAKKVFSRTPVVCIAAPECEYCLSNVDTQHLELLKQSPLFTLLECDYDMTGVMDALRDAGFGIARRDTAFVFLPRHLLSVF